jgi:4-amino-4-deoxy-L-arabinose transferase-like glycosyltransferase
MQNKLAKFIVPKPTAIYLVLIAIFLLIVYFIGFFNPIRGDAVRYAAVAQEMLHNNNFLELQNRGGIPYMQKPPLLFWIISTSYRLFGINHFAYKMPIFLISLVGILSMYKNARLNYDQRIAALASVFMTFSFGMIFYQNDIHTDSVIMATIIISIYQINLYLKNHRFIHLIIGFIFIGLSMLTKGPIGLAIPVFAFGVDILLKRHWKSIFKLEWIAGLIIIGIVISPAFIGVYRQFGMEGVEFYFVSNHTSRITGSLRVNNTDYLFYLHTLLWEFIPWSLLILYGLYKEMSSIVVSRFKIRSQDEALNIGGIIIFLLIISISKFKGPNYIIPLFPFFAVIAAKWVIQLYDSHSKKIIRWFSALHYLIVYLLWAIVLIVVYLNRHEISSYILVILLILFCTLISSFYILKHKSHRLLINLCAGITALGLLFNGFFVPLTFEYHSMLQACKIINETATKDTKFVMLETEVPGFSDDTFNFYLTPQPKFSSNIDEVLSMKSGWVFTDAKDFKSIQESGKMFSQIKKIPHLKKSLLPILHPDTRDQALKYNYLLKI